METKDMNILERLNEIQIELKAPKNKRNTFGNYSYRSAEDILEAVKPLCHKYGANLTISDDVVQVGSRVYVSAKVTLRDALNKDGGEVSNIGLAREAETKKGMDDSQITGTASSYARKYALNGMFCIDDNQDADTMESIRAQALAQVVMVETRQQFDALKKQYYGLIKADQITYKAFERAAKILTLTDGEATPAPETKTAAELTKEAMNAK